MKDATKINLRNLRNVLVVIISLLNLISFMRSVKLSTIFTLFIFFQLAACTWSPTTESHSEGMQTDKAFKIEKEKVPVENLGPPKKPFSSPTIEA